MSYLIHKFRLVSLCLLAMSLLPHGAHAQDINELKAALSYNFAKFTQWPKEAQAEESWQLCYIGEQHRAGFEQFKNKRLADRLITIKEIVDLQDIASCHIVYVASDKRKLLPRLFIALDNKPILTISDMPGFIAIGGMIEITSLDNHLKFKVNLLQLEQSQLRISSKVLKLAIEVRSKAIL